MSKKKPMDKTERRERRNRMLDSAAAAKLSLIEGVRDMRAIAGMTQEEFARHRGVSARVIKSLELGQGNPTMATMNRIGEFFGLEVAFVPIMREVPESGKSNPADHFNTARSDDADVSPAELIRHLHETKSKAIDKMTEFSAILAELDNQLQLAVKKFELTGDLIKSLPKDDAEVEPRAWARKKAQSS